MQAHNLSRKKVLVIHKNTIEKEPPTQMVIQHLLDLNIKVKLITLGVNDYWKKKLLLKDVQYVDLNMTFYVNAHHRSAYTKIWAWLKYRREVLKELAKPENKDYLVWFIDADSIAPLLGSTVLKKIDYVMHVLEMYDNSLFYKYILNKYIKTSQRLVVCEENRAAIFNLWFKPEKYPIVLQNKPYEILDAAESRIFLNESLYDVYHQLLNRKAKIILYQGLLVPDRDLTFILKAIADLNEEYVPILMGRDFGMVEKYKKICPRLIHIQFVPSPLHLFITSLARIGILIYDPISLNQIFCAPNKIYEYAGYGVPMIGNNVPGITIPLQKFACGVIFDYEENSEQIRDKIVEIDRNFDKFSKNARQLFNSIDNQSVIRSVLEQL